LIAIELQLATYNTFHLSNPGHKPVGLAMPKRLAHAFPHC